MKDLITWLCAVTSTGEASGDGKTMLRTERVDVGDGMGHCSVIVVFKFNSSRRFPLPLLDASTASCRKPLYLAVVV
jgi:hypothetical protein